MTTQLLTKSEVQKNKIQNLDELAETLASLKREGRKIVHCHGVFDLLHVGHIRHFKEARRMGDVLVVTITPDQYVNKGPHRPAFPQDLRAEVLASLDMVDFVAINRWPVAIEAIKLLMPDIYAKGPDYQDMSKDRTGNIKAEVEAVESVGGAVCFTNDITFSSSSLLNKHLSSLSDQANKYLETFRRLYSVDQLVGYLDNLRDLKVLVVGEAILDEYVYCDALGKSSKEPVLAVRHLRREMHAGGTLAIANHLADFCHQVDLLTYLGVINSREDFVRNQLRSNVRPTFVYKADSPTIVKRRYVENYYLSKMIEIYEINDEFLLEEEDKKLCEFLEQNLSAYDVVIVGDYGHGLVTPRAADLLSAKSNFMVVNTQINAANIGFHAISKYEHADYVCIQENEIRLDGRSRKGDLKVMTRDLAKRLGCRAVMITRGKHGTLLFDAPGDRFSECPAMAAKVVDRIGAGDSVLSITALCVAKNLPLDVTGFVGNLVGAQAVKIMGNSTSINRVQLIKSIESVLK